jgi:hypothetical protein
MEQITQIECTDLYSGGAGLESWTGHMKLS